MGKEKRYKKSHLSQHGKDGLSLKMACLFTSRLVLRFGHFYESVEHKHFSRYDRAPDRGGELGTDFGECGSRGGDTLANILGWVLRIFFILE